MLGCTSELYIFYIWNDNLQSLNREKMKHRYQSFTRIGRQFQSLERQVYADWTSVSFPFCQRSCLVCDEYTDEYNDEYLCRDFFVGFNFWSRLSFQISEFRVHWDAQNLPYVTVSKALTCSHWPYEMACLPSQKNLANESLRNVCIFPKFLSFQLFQSKVVFVKCCKEVIVPPEYFFEFSVFKCKYFCV